MAISTPDPEHISERLEPHSGAFHGVVLGFRILDRFWERSERLKVKYLNLVFTRSGMLSEVCKTKRTMAGARSSNRSLNACIDVWTVGMKSADVLDLSVTAIMFSVYAYGHTHGYASTYSPLRPPPKNTTRHRYRPAGVLAQRAGETKYDKWARKDSTSAFSGNRDSGKGDPDRRRRTLVAVDEFSRVDSAGKFVQWHWQHWQKCSKWL
ncbi:hypothetical protein K435DRAFT_790065 [Dendrothele bispora CBS 962.96]|uniref:Uncharacterized protein n=1 Tax=Dendrothele bispora (strain CBS 962.96) TaxID=1314807 RepID=A0A4S8MT45_DENBC|nr:hypothetical protein K435DRAFT_790065 [Dendrothele bispora CBS 962.96]